MKILYILMIFILLAGSAFACSMFTKTVDGKTLIANNEDWNDPNTYVWFEPGEGNEYDCMFVGYENLFPQGGLNEAGLYFDGFATAPKPIKKSLDKPLFDGWLNSHVMKTCATIDEVISIFDEFNLQFLERAMFMFVDKTGDAVIIEGDEYIRKKGDSQIVTNFYQSLVPEGMEYPCERYNMLVPMMQECEVSVADFRKALAAVHAEGEYPTIYSNIIDPNALVMFLYHFHNFENVAVIDMKEEMAKGYHVVEMSTLFPKTYAFERYVQQLETTLARVLRKIINEDGLLTALDAYEEQKSSKGSDETYPINEYELNILGYLYLNEGRFDEAIAIFKINVENFPDHCNCYDSLGEAYMTAGMKDLAIINYTKALELNPDYPSSRDALKILMNE